MFANNGVYPYDIPKQNNTEYQDERGETGDKYQLTGLIKSINDHMTEIKNSEDCVENTDGTKKPVNKKAK